MEVSHWGCVYVGWCWWARGVKRVVCHLDVHTGCVFLVEVGRGKLVCIAVGLCKGVPEVVESVGVEER